jgi:hypothetical protein
MTLLHESKPAAQRRAVGWAWLFVALIPVGFVLSVGAMFAMATWLGVDLLPDRGTAQISVAQGIFLGCASTLIALASPTIAVILAVRAERGGERSAKAARIVSTLLLALTVLAYTLTVSVFGLFGLAVVSAVLYVALRSRQPS